MNFKFTVFAALEITLINLLTLPGNLFYYLIDVKNNKLYRQQIRLQTDLW